jgi:hypothetical protein
MRKGKLVMKSKLPRRFAIAGVFVGLFLYAVSWGIYKFNPFHIPTFRPPALMEFYTFPPLYDFLTWDLPIVFCPAIFPLEFLTLDRGPAPDSAAWVVAVVINFPIYYCVGIIVDKVRRRISRAKLAPMNSPR